MPYNQLKRQDSFPPTMVHLYTADHRSTTLTSLDNKPLPAIPSEALHLDDDIDENPISFFLTTPNDHEEEFNPGEEQVDFFPESDEYDDDAFGFDEDLSAGIEGSEEDLRSKDVGVREVSPSSLQRQKQNEDDFAVIDDGDEEVEFGFAMPLSLKDYVAATPVITHTPSSPIDIATSGRASRASYRPDETLTEKLKGLGINIDDFASSPPSTVLRVRESDRGRGRVRLSSNNGKRSVSWSPNLNRRKPVSWRVPSRGIWRIDETPEDVAGLSSSAPAIGGIGMLMGGKRREEEQRKKRVVKRVHWAD